MPTIIDSLIVKLGLDSKDLDAKTPVSVRQLKALEKESGNTEDSVKKLGSASKETSKGFDNLTASAAKFLALIGGTVALKQFITDTITANAALNRFSQNIGLDVPTISAWGNAVEELGGSAKGLQGSLDMLSKAQTELRLTGESSLIPYFSALSVSLADVTGKARPVDEILLDLSDRFSHMDRTTANNMGRMMGIDQDTMNLLLQGRQEVELMIRRQKESNAVTKQQAEEAARLQRRIADLKQGFNAFGRDLLQLATPALEKLLGMLQGFGDWVRANSETVKAFLAMAAVGITAISVAALANPFTLIIAGVLALSAAIALLWQDYQTWKRGGDSLIDWEKWKPGIDKAVAGIHWLADEAEKAFYKIAKVAEAGRAAINGNWAAAKQALGEAVLNTPKNQVITKPLFENKPETGTPQQMQKYFQDRGLTTAQAAGIVANLMAESSGKSNAIGDKGTAYGIGQWHQERQEAFKRFFGHDIRQSTLNEQMAFVQHELKTSHKAAGDALLRAETPQEAGAIISRQYEKPADKEGEAQRRGASAEILAAKAPPVNSRPSLDPRFLQGIQGASALAAQAPGAPSVTTINNDRSVSVQTGDISIMTRAKDANGIAKDFKQSMDYLFTSQANSGLN